MPTFADEHPRVSVLMPMRNAASYVEQALRSILIEDRVSLEVVVADDGSADDSRRVVESLRDNRIRVIDGPCQGIAAAYNAALKASNGAIVMRCDADDIYPPRRISRQVDWLDAHPGFGAICGGFCAMDRRGACQQAFATPTDAGEITVDLLNGKTPTHFCTFAVRAAVLRATGGMRPFFITGEDIDLQLRIGELCRVWYSPEIAYHYRIHGGSITHNRHSRENLFFENLAREFQSQRKLTGADDLSVGRPPAVPQFGKADRHSAKTHMQNLLVSSTWSARDDGDYLGAMRHALQATIAKPTSWKGWRNLMVAVIKLSAPALRQKLRGTARA